MQRKQSNNYFELSVCAWSVDEKNRACGRTKESKKHENILKEEKEWRETEKKKLAFLSIFH